MGHRRRIQKKNFKCGHRGLGQYCHFCKQTKSEIIEDIKETPVQVVPNIVEQEVVPNIEEPV